MGVLSLGRPRNSTENVMNYIIQSGTDECLDIIDFILHIYWEIHKNNKYENVGSRTIDEIKYWFKYNSLGYEFINGELIRINDMHIHQGYCQESFANWLAVWQLVVSRRRDSTPKHPHRPGVSCSCSAWCPKRCLRHGVAWRRRASGRNCHPGRPTTLVLRRISRFRRSMTLLVRIFCQWA